MCEKNLWKIGMPTKMLRLNSLACIPFVSKLAHELLTGTVRSKSFLNILYLRWLKHKSDVTWIMKPKKQILRLLQCNRMAYLRHLFACHAVAARNVLCEFLLAFSYSKNFKFACSLRGFLLRIPLIYQTMLFLVLTPCMTCLSEICPGCINNLFWGCIGSSVLLFVGNNLQYWPSIYFNRYLIHRNNVVSLNKELRQLPLKYTNIRILPLVYSSILLL